MWCLRYRAKRGDELEQGSQVRVAESRCPTMLVLVDVERAGAQVHGFLESVPDGILPDLRAHGVVLEIVFIGN